LRRHPRLRIEVMRCRNAAMVPLMKGLPAWARRCRAGVLRSAFGCRAFVAIATGLLLVLAQARPAHADAASLHCRFASGLDADYRLTADRAGVRRGDVVPVRWGRVIVDPRQYRLVFDAGLERYRIVVVIDRATGDARRVFGTEVAMAQTFASDGAGRRLVRETGRCSGAALAPSEQ